MVERMPANSEAVRRVMRRRNIARALVLTLLSGGLLALAQKMAPPNQARQKRCVALARAGDPCPSVGLFNFYLRPTPYVVVEGMAGLGLLLGIALTVAAYRRKRPTVQVSPGLGTRFRDAVRARKKLLRGLALMGVAGIVLSLVHRLKPPSEAEVQEMQRLARLYGDQGFTLEAIYSNRGIGIDGYILGAGWYWLFLSLACCALAVGAVVALRGRVSRSPQSRLGTAADMPRRLS